MSNPSTSTASKSLVGRRLDELTTDERRALPDGTVAEERCGVIVNEYLKENGRWIQLFSHRSEKLGAVPWLARVTKIPDVPEPAAAHIMPRTAIADHRSAPQWTAWKDGTTELRCGRLLVARVARRSPNALEAVVPGAPELDPRRGTTGVFFGPDAIRDIGAYMADFGLPTLPLEVQS